MEKPTPSVPTPTLNIQGGYNVAYHGVYNLIASNAEGQDVLATWQITGDLLEGQKATVIITNLEKNTTYTWFVQHETSTETIQFTTDANGTGTVTTTEFSLWSLVKGANSEGTANDGYKVIVSILDAIRAAIEQTQNIASNVPEGANVVISFTIQGEIAPGQRADITFNLPKANTVYTIYAEHDDGTTDEYVRRTNSDNELTISTDQFSVWTIVEGGVLPTGSGSDGSDSSADSNTNGLTSPQTGHDLTAPIAAGIVAIALGATTAFALRKKITA